MFSPTCYALGYPGAGRCRNVFVIFLYLYLVLLEFYVVGWLRRKVSVNANQMKGPVCAGVAFVCMLSILLILTQDFNNYMSLSAVKSIYYKEAQLYHVIHLERERKNSKV